MFESRERRLRLLWAFAAFAALVQAWITRYSINPDGVGYLDQSDQILAHGVAAPINGYWSPLYPALLALVRLVFGSDAALDFPLAHLVNAGLCAVAFLCGELLRRELVRDQPDPAGAVSALCIAGTAWAAITLTTLEYTTPDLAVLAAVLGAVAALLRWRRDPAAWRFAAYAGVALGIGYLAKSVMFLIGIGYLGFALAAGFRSANTRRGVLIAFVSFAAIVTPQVLAVSRLHGSPTFGQTGELAYAWYIGRVPGPLGPEFERPAEISTTNGVSLVPRNPAQAAPRLFFIDGRTAGTFPLWSDVTRWYPENLSIPFHFGVQVRQTLRGIASEIESFWSFALALWLGWIINGSVRLTALREIDRWLIAWSGFPLVLYALVHVEKRLIAPFVLLLLLVIGRRFSAALPVYLLALAAVLNVAVTVRTAVKNREAPLLLYQDRDAFASFLRKNGGSHARLVALGDPYEISMAARLARARLVAIVDAHDTQKWWQSDSAGRADLLSKLRTVDGAIVVSARPPAASSIPGWSAIPGSTKYVGLRNPSTRGQ